MKPVIQFDKQFIIVIFLMMLLCTQRIFGYDLSLLTVRGIFALNTQFNSATFFSRSLSFFYSPVFVTWTEKYADVRISFHTILFVALNEEEIQYIYFFSIFFSFWCAFHHNISPYFLHAHDDTTKNVPQISRNDMFWRRCEFQ